MAKKSFLKSNNFDFTRKPVYIMSFYENLIFIFRIWHTLKKNTEFFGSVVQITKLWASFSGVNSWYRKYVTQVAQIILHFLRLQVPCKLKNF